MNMSFLTYCALFLHARAGATSSTCRSPERIAQAARPRVRGTHARAGRTATEAGVFRRLADFGRYVIGDTYSRGQRGPEGPRRRRHRRRARRTTPFDTLVDIVVADDLRTVLWPMPARRRRRRRWELRRRCGTTTGRMLGGSDAGAHLDRMCGAPYTDPVPRRLLRGPQARCRSSGRCSMITDDAGPAVRPARPRPHRRGLPRRPGACSTPRPSAPSTPRWSHDLPGGSARLTAGADGVVRVLVNGVETVRDGKATGALPGHLLRSGPDTDTVGRR